MTTRGCEAGNRLTPKTLIIRPCVIALERSVQFNLLTLETAHHGKCTLGNDASRSRKRGFSSVGRASALQAECQRFESVNLHHSSPFFAYAAKGYEWQAISLKRHLPPPALQGLALRSFSEKGPVAQLVRAPP